MIKSFDIVNGLVDMGAPEVVVLGLGRVQIIGSDLLRFACYDQHASDDGQMIRVIKQWQTWPLHAWLRERANFWDAANFVQREIGVLPHLHMRGRETRLRDH